MTAFNFGLMKLSRRSIEIPDERLRNVEFCLRDLLRAIS